MEKYCGSKLDAKKFEVVVRYEPQNDPPFSFTTNLPKGKKKNQLIFRKGKSDGFLIRYELDSSFGNYTFGSDLAKALYSTSEPKCPKVAGQWSEFRALCIEDSGRALVVHNANSAQAEFGYALRVTNDGGQNYLDLDPIGTNENANDEPLVDLTVAFVGAVGAAAGALIANYALPTATETSVIAAAVGGAVLALAIYLLLLRSRERMA